jgi:hypothetical protein
MAGSSWDTGLTSGPGIRRRGKKASMNTNRITSSLLLAILLFASAGDFATIMTSEVNRNEHMYHAASVFASQGRVLYKDFSYLQTPYLPLLYGSLFKIFHVSSHYLLIARLFSFLCLCVSAAILFLVARRVLKEIVMPLCIVTLFLLNMTIVQSAAEISNYILPVAFSFAGFYLFFRLDPIKPVSVALAGFFVALAIGTKLTYASVMMAFLGAVFVYPVLEDDSVITFRRDALRVMLPFGVGAAIGFLPILSYLTDLEAFRFNNLGYHQFNTQWREITGYSGATSLPAKIVYAFAVLRQPDNLIVFMGIAFGLVLPFEGFPSLKRSITRSSVGVVLALLLFIVSIPTAVAPTPSFVQYYAMPVSFLFLLLVYACASHSGHVSTLNRRWLFILMIGALAYTGPALLKRVASLTERQAWVGLRVHDASMVMRNAIANHGGDVHRPIATLSPILVIEANLSLYPQFSTGPFLYRIGDLLTPELRKKFVGTSRETVGELLSADPPAAILAGFEKDLDNPLIEYAQVHDYRLVDVSGLEGQLYVRSVAKTSYLSSR